MTTWFVGRLRVAMVCSVLAAACAPRAAHSQQPDSAAWLADLTQLRAEMSAHYANLQWAVGARGLDLPALTSQTERQLASARTVPEARAVIESFLRAFGDGHLYVSWPSAANGAAGAGEAPLCTRLDFGRAPRAGLPFHRAARFTPIQSADSVFFPAGVVETPSGRRIGVLRIGLFSQYAFPQLCDQVARELGLTGSSPCDEACEGRVEATAGNLLTAALVRQLELLGRERTELLLVDITGNGGGTNWVQPAARTLTAVRLATPAQGFARHPHWTRQFAQRIEVLQRERRGADAALRARIDAAVAAYRRAGEEAGRSCDLAPLWEGRSAGCSLTATAGVFASGALAYAAPGELGPVSPAHRYLFSPSLYAYREGVYTGPLAVLVDRGTSSSAEYFTAMLADNGAATILGHPTDGTGCGYTNGGIRTVLAGSGAVVRMPDCVRYRADGTNEVEGVTPHVLVPWRAVDNPYQRAMRVVAVLDTLRIPTPAP